MEEARGEEEAKGEEKEEEEAKEGEEEEDGGASSLIIMDQTWRPLGAAVIFPDLPPSADRPGAGKRKNEVRLNHLNYIIQVQWDESFHPSLLCTL